MTTLTQPIKWHGGKHYLAPLIISHFPQHVHYVEPYFGGGSVLLQKPEELVEGHSEVVNDKHVELVNFWQVLSDENDFEEFVRIVEATPLCQCDWARAETAWWQTESRSERAARFFIRARQSRQGLMKDFATLSRNRTRRGMNEQVSSWLTAVEGLPDVHARLKRVVILNDDALKVIKQQDGPNTLFYLDPPYLHETRVTTSDYQHEMTIEQHHALLELLSGISGKFILSGYPSALYKRFADDNGWRLVETLIDNKASSKKTKEKKTECLWMNYDSGATQ